MKKASKQLFKRGAKAVVRYSSKGMAVVLSKKARNQGYSLIKLKDALNDGWFIHPDGFLASFGGPKAPKCLDDALPKLIFGLKQYSPPQYKILKFGKVLCSIFSFGVS